MMTFCFHLLGELFSRGQALYQETHCARKDFQSMEVVLCHPQCRVEAKARFSLGSLMKARAGSALLFARTAS